MGAVFAAHDPELDRKVALKFLHSRLTGSDHGPVQETRLFREGQAMAKLAHANVATVYDVGSYHGRVYIAMEFIDGQTFGDWLAAEQRPWSEIWPVLRGAGRGLAAAHAAGIVHRDFKPDNILVSRDGIAKVTDFGLAAPSGERAGEDGDAEASDTTSSSGALHERASRRLLTSSIHHSLRRSMPRSWRAPLWTTCWNTLPLRKARSASQLPPTNCWRARSLGLADFVVTRLRNSRLGTIAWQRSAWIRKITRVL